MSENRSLEPGAGRYPRAARITRKADFDRVLREGAAARDPLLKVAALPNEAGVTRLGVAVSRKAARGSVERNRLKRRLREAFRLERGRLPPGLDLVVIPLTAPGEEPPFPAVRESLVRLAHKAAERVRARAGAARPAPAPPSLPPSSAFPPLPPSPPLSPSPPPACDGDPREEGVP